MITPKGNNWMTLSAAIVVVAVMVGCSRSERMDMLYLQRCVNCHGPSGRGDGQMTASLPVRVPDFRDTVERKSNAQMRRVIREGKGLMPAFDPALNPGEINDMVRMVRLLSREGREVSWWEKYDALVIAHCSVPWEAVFGYDEPPETSQARENSVQGSRFNVQSLQPHSDPQRRIP